MHGSYWQPARSKLPLTTNTPLLVVVDVGLATQDDLLPPLAVGGDGDEVAHGAAGGEHNGGSGITVHIHARSTHGRKTSQAHRWALVAALPHPPHSKGVGAGGANDQK